MTTPAKRIGIMQPYFMPYLGYWQLMSAVNVYVVYDDVNYIKGGWINRNRLRLASGQVSYATLSVSKASPNRLICDHKLSDLASSGGALLRKLECNYGKRPQCAEAIELLKEVLSFNGEGLADFLCRQIRIVSSYLGIEVDIVRSSELGNDKSLRGQEKVLDIVGMLDGDAYINAIGGACLYSGERFSSAGIKLEFLKPELPEYDQGFSTFEPGLSILDVIANCSREEVSRMASMGVLLSPEEALGETVPSPPADFMGIRC